MGEELQALDGAVSGLGPFLAQLALAQSFWLHSGNVHTFNLDLTPLSWPPPLQKKTKQNNGNKTEPQPRKR